MNELLFMIVALITGALLGIVFFGGLWLTVRKAIASKTPALWFLGSIILRIGIVLVGFYLIMQRGSWLIGLLCLLGFIAGRVIVVRLTRDYESAHLDIKEVHHES